MKSILSGFRVVARRAWLLTLVAPAMSFSIAQACAQSASVENRSPDSVTPGTSIFGKNDYIEYVVGNLPVVISVPHGGYLKPQEIPDRVLGTKGHQDTKTQELAREIVECFRQLTGKVPHVIINRLHRDKLDANRELFDAAQDDSIATNAWNEFHGFIDSAEERTQRDFGKVLYIDLHGHRHDWQVVELGYLLVSNQLRLDDHQVDSVAGSFVSSFGPLPNRAGITPSSLIRGELSLGALLHKNGFASVPSPAIPHPDGMPYFSGGYNLEQHSAFSGREAWGIQVEIPTGIRENDSRRHDFALAFVKSVIEFMSHITG